MENLTKACHLFFVALTSSIFFLNTTKCWAFPENVRHGYFSCTACHVSPSGGGALTPYWKSLSAELMSTWGTVKNAGLFFSDNEDETKNPQWWRSNIFLRGVQMRRDTPTVEKAQFIPMQGDFETGVDTDKFAAMVTVGFRSGYPAKSKDLNELFSRRHYVLYRFTDSWMARAGKFMFSFGLNGPDHVTATRRGLGWDQGTDSYNLEITHLAEKNATILSVIDNSPEEKGTKKEKGLSINQSFYVNDDSRVGLSGYTGGPSEYNRAVVGPYWTWSFSKNVFLDSELFYQQKKIKADSSTQNGYATFQRIGWELAKGFALFAQFDRSFLNTADQSTQYDSYGPGFQWLPYPHFETMAFVGKEKVYGSEANDFAWLMLNIYL